MADYYVDENGNVTTKKQQKKKKKNVADYYVDESGNITKSTNEDIAPTRSTDKNEIVFYEQKNQPKLKMLTSTPEQMVKFVPEEDINTEGGYKKSWFKSGGFSDGVDDAGDFFVDLGQTVGGTVGDFALGAVKGVGRLVEGIVDLGTYGVAGVADLFGADDFAKEAKDVAIYSATDEWTKPAVDFLDKYSVLGDKSDMVSEGIGQVAAIIATGGIAGAAGASSGAITAITTGVTGLSGMGNGMTDAYNSGATDGEAVLYGFGVGAIEAATELLSGGLGKSVKALGVSRGIGGLDDMFAKKLSSSITKSITNETVQKVIGNGIEATVKAGGEGAEEVLSGLGSAVMKKLTYASDEDIRKLIDDEDLLEQFVVGAITSSIVQTPDLVKANASGRDFVTGYTDAEQTVIDKEVEKRVSEKEKNGKKLTTKEIGAIKEQVVSDMAHGQIDIDTIESVLGGDKYKAYKNTVESEDALKAEYEQLANIKANDMTHNQRKRLLELEKMNLDDTTKRDTLRKNLDDEMARVLNNNDKLAESYRERARRGEAFDADLSKYNKKQRAAVERAINSGVLNNTYRSHELVNVLSKIEAEKGIVFDYTNNKKLKQSGFAIDGKIVNGYKDNATGSVTLNVQSAKAWQSVVGHEITHVLEGTDAYDTLRQALYEYAESKGELANRRASITELYDGINADVDAELTADLVGDYLFTDKDFINNLTGNRTLFQKIYDEIKYLYKIATGKELTEIEKVKREFDKAWKEFSTEGINETISETDVLGEADIDYSVSVTDKETLDSLNKQVARGEYDAETNPDGGYYVTYKSMSFWGYDKDGNAILRSPMAEYVDGELSNAYLIPKDKSKLNWYQATETIDENTGLPSGLLVKVKQDGKKSFSYLPASENQHLINDDWSNLYFNLRKKVQKNGKWVYSDVPARYNPYEHSSNSMLDDQFSAAYLRDNLVTVKMYVPISEDNGAYRAKWSKDPTGWSDWKTGTVAGKIGKQKDLQRRVYLSRYAAPVEIVPDSEVAQAYKHYIEGTDVAIPDNVVSPNLLNELRKAGVPIEESGMVQYSTPDSYSKSGIEYDKSSSSCSPIKYSISSWDKTDYVTDRKKAAADMAKNLGVTEEQASKYIDDVNSIAKIIADDKERLSYEPSPNRSAFVSNAEYGGSIDFSTICKKRRLFTGTFEAIQNALPNTALTAEEVLEIRKMMKDKGYEVSCGLCYVEGSRANMGQYTKQFIERYKATNPEYVPNMAEMNTATGQEKIRKEHPEVYEAYEYFMNHYGRLSPSDKALFASQQKPKMYQMSTEYKGEILQKFGGKNSSVENKNKNGGLRLQSFSDFEIIHLIDSMQVIMDMSRVGLAGQAYTKVPDFAWALGDTGLKINLSLIAKGVDANGRLILDEVEGMKESDAMALRDRYSDNVGTIIVVFTDEQLKAAMADERIDYIIPYHRSQWKASQYDAMGLPENTRDYTLYENESYIEDVFNKNGKKQRPSNYMPNTYWDFSKSGKENAEAYLRMCAENNRKPKFSHLLVDNGDGSYSLQPDGSTDGYWKTLIDFKMYNNDGVGVPQNPVTPNFNMEEAKRMLNEYTGGHEKFPVAKDIVDEFVSKHPDNIAPVDKQYSIYKEGEEYAPVGDYSTPFNELALENDVAPVADNVSPVANNTAPALENIPVLPDEELADGTTESIKPQPKRNQNTEPKLKRVDSAENNQSERIAKVLVEEPEVKKKERGIFSKAITNFIDKGAEIENLSLKTKNRALQDKYKTIGRSETKATYFMEHGTEGVKSLDEIRAEVEKTGKVQEFYDYIYHKHNIDRMSLESKELPNLQRLTEEMANLKLLNLQENQLRAIASEKITKETAQKRANTIKTVREYLASKDVKNKPVFDYSVTSEMSQDIVNKLEAANPEFKKYAQDVYDYMNHLRKMMVDNGIISEDTAKLWSEMYPNYVPIRRVGKDGMAVNVPLDTNKTGINAPIKGATGGNSDILPLFNTMAQRTTQTFKAVDKNRFGIELKNTLGGVVESTKTNLDEVIDSIDAQDSLLQEGKNGKNPTFTVFENGDRVTFDITEGIYDALKPTSEALSYTNKALNTVSNLHRGMLTEYNPVFMATNAIKDAQDVLINSQHPAKTYANLPVSIKELITKGKWYTEYMENGGGDNTYFDKQTNTFTKEKSALRKIVGFPLDKISDANNFIEKVPRLAEYIASRKGGASVDAAMLDAARVTTDFSAGGDVTKFLNRNGATFLNASVQGFAQQIRNVREAKMNGLKGWLGLAAKCAIAGLPAVLLNHLLWDDDEEYAELSDYVKENYYVVAKYGDGKFVRIPKGRTLAVIQNGFEQIGNALTGDDEVDFGRFFDLFVSNLAPNNPIDNNIIAPIKQAVENKTWYGEDLVPTRLQDLPAGEQYDESTDSISKWLGENLNISPYKINYLLNQYSGGVGDVILPMLTPEAESGDNSFVGNLIAPMRDKFTTDSVMNNQNISDFYDKMDELTTNAKSSAATDEDILKYKYFNSVNKELGELYGSKREIQNAPYSDDIKYNEIRDIQKQIVDKARETLSAYNNVVIDGDYATVGDRHFHKDENGAWEKISDDQLEKQKNVTKALGISGSEYWNNKSEYDYAYKNPEKYAFAKAVGGYSTYKTYSSELYDIKSDKDANGKSISGSRKEKVIDYINNLDADYYTKIILFKSEYPSDDTYNAEIVNYIVERNDLTYEDKVAVLTELGFRIAADGQIYAD